MPGVVAVILKGSFIVCLLLVVDVFEAPFLLLPAMPCEEIEGYFNDRGAESLLCSHQSQSIGSRFL